MSSTDQTRRDLHATVILEAERLRDLVEQRAHAPGRDQGDLARRIVEARMAAIEAILTLAG